MKKHLFLLILISLCCSFLLYSESSRPGLKVAAVQLHIDEDLYSSVESFRRRISELIAECRQFEPDLIIFPEYTSVFIALIPYSRIIKKAANIAEAWEMIKKQEPLLKSYSDLFLFNSGLVERVIYSVFADLAAEHGVNIIGGSYFAWKKTGENDVTLRNRAFLFDDKGRLIYVQDKVFLTRFEREIIGISPGSMENAIPFSINQRRIALSICRDTFMSDWEEHFAGSDLWLDIKANGTKYTPEEAASFMRALPARIGPAGVGAGITTVLTGEFLDLFWEGESSLAIAEDGRVKLSERAKSASEEEILFLTID